MAEDALRCNEDVPEPPGYWHSHKCDRRAKWQVSGQNLLARPVCGTHVKHYERQGKAYTISVAEGSES